VYYYNDRGRLIPFRIGGQVCAKSAASCNVHYGTSATGWEVTPVPRSITSALGAPMSLAGLLSAIAKARAWVDDLVQGRLESFTQLAEQEGKVERHNVIAAKVEETWNEVARSPSSISSS
jgi:hypothetical protein